MDLFVSLPTDSMVILHSYADLPESTIRYMKQLGGHWDTIVWENYAHVLDTLSPTSECFIVHL